MHLFVYGTLKQGFHNHHILENVEFICEATTKERYPMVNIEKCFLYLINAKGYGKNVQGEVYRMDEKVYWLCLIF